MFSISLSYNYGLSHCKNEYKQPSFKLAVLKVCNSGNVGCDSYEQTPHKLTKHLQLAIKHHSMALIKKIIPMHASAMKIIHM